MDPNYTPKQRVIIEHQAWAKVIASEQALRKAERAVKEARVKHDAAWADWMTVKERG